jgi:hypothetical protein
LFPSITNHSPRHQHTIAATNKSEDHLVAAHTQQHPRLGNTPFSSIPKPSGTGRSVYVHHGPPPPDLPSEEGKSNKLGRKKRRKQI